MQNSLDLVILFFSALFAATILPVQSELFLFGLNLSGKHSAITLLMVATFGNVLGSLINWFFGRYLLKFENRKWFPVNKQNLQRATNFYKKWGIWSLLLAWLPIIGDPLTVVAGFLKTNIGLFLLLVAIGKMGRYLVVLSL